MAPKKVNVKIEPDDDEAMEVDNKAKVLRANKVDEKAKGKMTMLKSGGLRISDETGKKVNVKIEPDDEAMEFDNKAKVKKADDVDEKAKGKLAMAVDEKAKGKMSMLKPEGLRIGDETGKRKIETEEVTSPNKRKKLVRLRRNLFLWVDIFLCLKDLQG